MKRNVVYDIDNTLNNLNDVVVAEANIDTTKHIKYDWKENDYSKKEVDRIMDLYADAEVYKKTTFVKGYEKIFDVSRMEETNVMTHSLSYRRRIKYLKNQQLNMFLPFLREENIILELEEKGSLVKSVLDNVFILVEDCLENILKSRARINILLKKEYNNPINYGITSLNSHNIILADDLSHANFIVLELLKK